MFGRPIACTLAFSAVLAGCSAPSRIDQMTVAPQASATYAEALRQNIAIKDVTGGRETNPLLTSQVESADLERALESSLKGAGLLQPDRAAGRYTLTAHIQALDQRAPFVSVTVTVTILYFLVERSTAKTVWERTLVTTATASGSDAPVGAVRVMVANEGAVRNNIAALLEALGRLKP